MNYHDAGSEFASMASDTLAFDRLLKSGLTGELFLGIAPDERRILAFVLKWHERDGTVPPRKVLEDEFEQFYATREIPAESALQPEYLVAWLKNNLIKSEVQVLVKNDVERLFDEDADQVVELGRFRDELDELHSTVSQGSSFDALLMSPGDYGDEEGTDGHIVPNLVVPGCITCIAALFKTGKTEFVSTMLHEIERGSTFMNRPVKQSNILYLTEERESTFGSKVKRYDFGSGVQVLHRHKVTKRWDELIDEAARWAIDKDHPVIVVDTFTRWAGIENENDNGEVTRKMKPLERAAGMGLAVIILHQHGKGEKRGFGRDVRGASAFGDAVDILVEMNRDPRLANPKDQRSIETIGRFDSIYLTVEWSKDRGYFLVEDRSDDPDAGVGFPRIKDKTEGRYNDTLAYLELRGEDGVTPKDLGGTTSWAKSTCLKYLDLAVSRGAAERVQDRPAKFVYKAPTG